MKCWVLQLEGELRKLESQGGKQSVALEAALDRANAKVKTLEAKVGHLEKQAADP